MRRPCAIKDADNLERRRGNRFKYWLQFVCRTAGRTMRVPHPAHELRDAELEWHKAFSAVKELHRLSPHVFRGLSGWLLYVTVRYPTLSPKSLASHKKGTVAVWHPCHVWDVCAAHGAFRAPRLTRGLRRE